MKRYSVLAAGLALALGGCGSGEQGAKPAAPAAATIYAPEAEAILARFLEFARFPLLCRVQSQGGEQVLEWQDLRFSVPGRAFPFVLQLRLDAQGRLQHWLIGRRG